MNKFVNVFRGIEKNNELLTTYVEFVKQINPTYTGTAVPFIGSQPIQLLQNNVQRLLDLSTVITPKLDGVRFTAFVKADKFILINRNGDVYEPSSETVSETVEGFLKDYSVLLDLELVQLKDGKFVAFIFDMVFEAECKKLIKTYEKDYNIRQFKLIQLMKSFQLPNNAQFKFMYKGYFEFHQYKNESYEDICVLWQNVFYNGEKLAFDGVIFINPSFKYTIGTFGQPSYGQYKWKPQKMISVDLLVNKQKTLVDKNDAKWDKINSFELDNSIQIGETYEFYIKGVGKDGKINLILNTDKGEREKGANSIFSLESAYDAYTNFVSYDKIRDAFGSVINDGKKTGEIAKNDILFMSKDKFLQLVHFSKEFHLVSPINEIKDKMFNLYKDYMEKSFGCIDKQFQNFSKARYELQQDEETSEKTKNLIEAMLNTIVNSDEASVFTKSTKMKFECYIELTKPLLPKNEKITNIKNNGIKNNDVMYLLNKLQQRNLISGVRHEVEYKVVKRIVNNDTEITNYNYHLTDSGKEVLNVITSKPSVIKEIIKLDDYFNYAPTINFSIYGENTIKKGKRIKSESIKEKVFVKRYKTIYDIKRLNQYTGVRITKVDEFKKYRTPENVFKFKEKPTVNTFLDLIIDFESIFKGEVIEESKPSSKSADRTKNRPTVMIRGYKIKDEKHVTAKINEIINDSLTYVLKEIMF